MFPPPVHKAISACLFHMSLVLNDLMPQPLAETEVWRVLPFEGGKIGGLLLISQIGDEHYLWHMKNGF